MNTALQSTSALDTSVSDYGNVRDEFQSLLAGCGIYHLSWRGKINVTGGHRARWLNGMISNNVRDLQPGHGVYAFILNPQGHIQGDLYAFHRGDSFVLDMELAQRDKIMQWLRRYIIADDVQLTELSDKLTAIGLTGPKSREIMQRAGINVPELEHLQFADLNWRDIPITILRSGEEAGESWQIWIPPDRVNTIWEALVNAGAKPSGTSALNLFRIAKGIPQYGQDIRERDLPHETRQMRALNFNKGCYLGQEIVERIRARGAVHRQFTSFSVEGRLPEPGTKIQSEGKEVGEVTTSAILLLPGRDRPVALGYLRREAEGKELIAGDARLVSATATFA